MRIGERLVEKGKKEGILVGIEKGMEKIINNMLASNMTVTDIAKVTKLSPEEIKKLKRKAH